MNYEKVPRIEEDDVANMIHRPKKTTCYRGR